MPPIYLRGTARAKKATAKTTEAVLAFRLLDQRVDRDVRVREGAESETGMKSQAAASGLGPFTNG